MQENTILVIDDDPETLTLIQQILRREGGEVILATTGSEGLRQVEDRQPDLVILDIMMPQMDGWEVCRRVREVSNAPIIILTVLDQQESAIRGLALGADDYITKPFRPRAFLARVRIALNRIQQSGSVMETAGYDDGYLIIELRTHRVFAAGLPVTLTSSEFALLALLLRNADQVCTFDQIINHLWGESGQGSFESVHLLISQLRKKIEPDPQAPWYLQREQSLGYRFRKRSQF